MVVSLRRDSMQMTNLKLVSTKEILFTGTPHIKAKLNQDMIELTQSIWAGAGTEPGNNFKRKE